MTTSIQTIARKIERESKRNIASILAHPSELDPRDLSADQARQAMLCGADLVVEQWVNWALREIVQGRWDSPGSAPEQRKGKKGR